MSRRNKWLCELAYMHSFDGEPYPVEGHQGTEQMDTLAALEGGDWDACPPHSLGAEQALVSGLGQQRSRGGTLPVLALKGDAGDRGTGEELAVYDEHAASCTVQSEGPAEYMMAGSSAVTADAASCYQPQITHGVDAARKAPYMNYAVGTGQVVMGVRGTDPWMEAAIYAEAGYRIEKSMVCTAYVVAAQ